MQSSVIKARRINATRAVLTVRSPSDRGSPLFQSIKYRHRGSARITPTSRFERSMSYMRRSTCESWNRRRMVDRRKHPSSTIRMSWCSVDSIDSFSSKFHSGQWRIENVVSVNALYGAEYDRHSSQMIYRITKIVLNFINWRSSICEKATYSYATGKATWCRSNMCHSSTSNQLQ